MSGSRRMPMQKTIASNSGEYSASNGQLTKTESENRGLR
jgi:hypothetical protein